MYNGVRTLPYLTSLVREGQETVVVVRRACALMQVVAVSVFIAVSAETEGCPPGAPGPGWYTLLPLPGKWALCPFSDCCLLSACSFESQLVILRGDRRAR